MEGHDQWQRKQKQLEDGGRAQHGAAAGGIAIQTLPLHAQELTM
jgi:hypothetical protein